MLNLGAIAPGSYFVSGAYGVSEGTAPFPLQALLKVELMSNVLEIHGKWHHTVRAEHAFKLQFLRDHTSQSQSDVVVEGTFIHPMKGRASLSRPSHEVLATDESRQQLLSVHFSPTDDRGDFEISGFVTIGDKHYSFHGRASQTEGRETLSNVVAIGGRAA